MTRRPYPTEVNAIAGNGHNTPAAAIVAALQAELQAKVWPGTPPDIDLVDAELDVPKAHYEAGAIVVKRRPSAAPAEVLDAILFEANNALNPAIAAAQGAPPTTPVGTYASNLTTAEFTTLKNHVRDLVSRLVPGGFPGFNVQAVQMLQQNGLGPQAVRTLEKWLSDYVPIYAQTPPAYPARSGIAPPPPPHANAVIGAAIFAPNQRDPHAARLFANTIHDPNATGPDALLSQVTSYEYYHVQRIMTWSSATLKAYCHANFPAGQAIADMYAFCFGAGASLPTNAKIGAYACMIDALRTLGGMPQTMEIPPAVVDRGKGELFNSIKNSNKSTISGWKPTLVQSLITHLAPNDLGRIWNDRAKQ